MTYDQRLLPLLLRGYLRHAPGALGKAALARSLATQYRERPVRRAVQARFGARYLVDTEDLIQRQLYLTGVWEPHLTHWLQHRLQPGDVFVDVGANIGYYSVLGAGLVGQGGGVVAIEASPAIHRRLRQNARLNGCGNLRSVNAAVADKPSTLHFIQASARNAGSTSIIPYDGSAVDQFEIEAHPLPELLTTDEIQRARVIKIDVEGAEGAVVRGLAPVLDRLRADAELVIEVTPERMRALGDSVEELRDTFARLGFHTYRLTNSYDPGSYPAAIRRPQLPRRWRGPITGEMDLVFSRIDTERLT